MKSTFDFIERIEIEKYSQTEKLETPLTETLFASAGGVEVSEVSRGRDSRE